jgi:hypothetical protein
LKKTPSQSPDYFDSLIEKCHLVTVQGYRSRVAEILDPVVTEERSDLDEAKLRVLRLQLAAAKIETEGKLEDANRLVVSVWNEISDDNEPDGNMSDVLCWTLLYVAYKHFFFRSMLNTHTIWKIASRLGSIRGWNQCSFV